MGYFIGFECLDWQSIEFIMSLTRSLQQSEGQLRDRCLFVSMYVRARQSWVTITFYSVFTTLPFWKYFHRSQEIIIIFSRWKSIWLMKNTKFPQPDVSLQPKHLQAVCSADTRVFYLFLCKWSVDFMCISMPHTPTAVTVTAHTTYRSNWLHRLHTLFQIRKLSCFSQASRFLSYVFSLFSFLRTV
jgi:hypothetical protein